MQKAETRTEIHPTWKENEKIVTYEQYGSILALAKMLTLN